MIYSILNVAYPFSLVSSSTAGGAEQVLLSIDSAICDRGDRSFVLAAKGSQVRGKLVDGFSHEGLIERQKCRREYLEYREALKGAVLKYGIDLVHFHGIDFKEYLPDLDIPCLVTIHLPLDWYSEGAFDEREGLYFNCVSFYQHRRCGIKRGLLSPVENGVAVPFSQPRRKRGRFAVCLGRICPEKGYHKAIDAAVKANVPLLLAGTVFPYQEHLEYFAKEIQPRLDGFRYRFIGQAGDAEKKRILGTAGCLLVPSLVPETSSLAAMEALSYGAPVIAFRNGALVDIVQDGVNGYLVENIDEMAEAIEAAEKIDPEVCYAIAKEKYSVERMTDHYCQIYRMLIGKSRADLYMSGDDNQLRDCG